MNDIRRNPRAHVVSADVDGNPIYSIATEPANKTQVAEVLEMWVNNPDLTITEIAAAKGLHLQTVSRYMDLWLYKRESQDTYRIRIKSNV